GGATTAARRREEDGDADAPATSGARGASPSPAPSRPAHGGVGAGAGWRGGGGRRGRAPGALAARALGSGRRRAHLRQGRGPPAARRADGRHRHRPGHRRGRRPGGRRRTPLLRRPQVAGDGQGVPHSRGRDAGGEVPVKWRALAVAVACLSTALWACSFQKEWEAYCAHPGRCARFDAGDNDTIQIAQGSSNRKILLGGQYLEGATVSLNPADSGMVSVVPVVPAVHDGILLDVTVKHGVGVGERLTVHFHWDRDSEDQDSIPLVVTPITATADPIADDDAGFGTPLNPYRTLLRASQHSDTGDIIHLGAGTFSSICTTSPGLKLGVTVEGEPGLPDGGGRSMVEGPGPCGFTLSDPAQALRLVTISNFDAGLVATADAGRPTASG